MVAVDTVRSGQIPAMVDRGTDKALWLIGDGRGPKVREGEASGEA